MVPGEETLATLLHATNEIEATVATTMSALRRKQRLAEAETVIRPMIAARWLPATTARETVESERRGGNGHPDDDGDGDDDCQEGGNNDGAPGDFDRHGGNTATGAAVVATTAVYSAMAADSTATAVFSFALLPTAPLT